MNIDKYIVPLIKYLWKHDIVTYFSCAGHKDDWDSTYLVFKYNRRFINYLWKNGLAIERMYNSSDKRFQYIVRSEFREGLFCKENWQKLCRDRFLSILKNYR